MILEAIVRRIQRISGDAQPSLDEFGNTLVSELLPAYAKLAAAGKIFVVDMSAGTAVVPVVAMPTTTPSWGLYNSSSKESLVPILVAASVAAGTSGLGLSIVMAAAIGPQTLVSANYSGTIITATDGSKKGLEAFLDNDPTLVGGTPAWLALEGTKINTIATNSVGDTIVAKTDGMFIARPKGMVAFEFVGETGATLDIQILVAQLELDLY